MLLCSDCRYLDIVPIKAGKLEALEYVRKLYKFPVSRTVSCGDSGNDILMLAGSAVTKSMIKKQYCNKELSRVEIFMRFHDVCSSQL
jgi:hydroxymethylpyrimidine pyrophosphatase-like HAD family hydrolase